jgi:hypothetical protein
MAAMIAAELLPRAEDALAAIDADATFNLPHRPLVPREAVALWEDVRALLDAPDIRRIDVWVAHGYMEHFTTVGFLLHLGEVARKAGKVVRVRTRSTGEPNERAA